MHPRHQHSRLPGRLLPLVVLVVLVASTVLGAPKPVGIVLSGDPAIFVEKADGGREALVKGMKLFPADVVVPPAGATPPEVKWWPYAGWKDAGAARLEVAFAPPGSGPKEGLLARLKGFMGFVETEYDQVQGVSDQAHDIAREDHFSESSEEKEKSEMSDSFSRQSGLSSDAESPSEANSSFDMSAQDGARPPAPSAKASSSSAGGPARKPPTQPRPERPRPASGSTLMRDVVVNFVGANGTSTGGRFLVTDDQGKEVFASEARQSVIFKPAEMKLEAGRTYTWRFSDEPPTEARTIRLLDPDTEALVRADFQQLKTQEPDRIERKMQFAAYLQMLSDLSPDQVDLYWLSYRLLREVQRDRADHPNLERFFTRYNQHTLP